MCAGKQETGTDPVRAVSNDFGEELRRRRLEAGLSLYDLSVRINYSRGHLSKVENAAVLDKEIARIPANARRARTRFTARLALAYAAAGEVDHACALTRGLPPDAHDVGSATIRHDLRQLASMFRRWHSHASVRDVQPGLDHLLRLSSSRD